MKVLFVSSGNGKFGISPIIKSQGISIRQQGIDLEFFTIQGKGFVSYLKHSFSLRRKLKETKYNIIHAHFGICGLLSLISKRNEPLIVSFMGDDLLGSNKSDGSISLKSQIMAFINKIISKIFYHATIVKSTEMLKKHGKTKRLFLIANGVDIDMFQPLSKAECRVKIAWEENRYQILFASNQDRPEKNYKLIIKTIKSIEGLNNIKLQCIKDVEHDEVPIYLNASDLLILSSFHEGSPNIIKEAMACNCPIVCTNVGDTQWVIGGTKGCFITSFKEEDIAEKIKFAIDFRQKHLFTSGRDRIMKLGLDSKTVAGKIIEVYNKVLMA